MIRQLAILLFLVGLTATTPGWALVFDDQVAAKPFVRKQILWLRDKLGPQIEAALKKYRVPGLSLTLVRGHEVLWSEGFGYADLAQRRPATPDTVYRVGSLAKPFTAMAVMQLAEAGEIDIDQPLDAYLPDFSIRSRFDTTAEPITVRAVLSHHAGLPTDLSKGMWSEQAYLEVAAQLREEYTAFPPNLVFSYSNLGYTLLGHMVGEVSGVPYPLYMQERIFRPFEMSSSLVAVQPVRGKHAAKGYRQGQETELLPIRDLPSHGLSTTSADLGRFMSKVLTLPEANNRPPNICVETLEEMFEPQNLDVDLDLNIVNGLGWFLEQESIPGSDWVVRHGGTTLAFSSELILLPQQGLGVAVLANDSGAREIVSRLGEVILEQLLDAQPSPDTEPFFLTSLERLEPSVDPVDIEGNYATDFGLISIRAKDAKLCACMVEKTFDLIPYPNGWFGASQDALAEFPRSFKPLGQMRFRSERIGDREVVVGQHKDKKILLGEKVPATEVPQSWLRRVGRYEVLNPDRDFPVTEPRLKMRDGQLCMSYKMPRLSGKTIQVPLRTISDTEAIVLGIGRSRGETLRAVTVDGEEGLRYSGYVGRKLRQSADTDTPTGLALE